MEYGVWNMQKKVSHEQYWIYLKASLHVISPI